MSGVRILPVELPETGLLDGLAEELGRYLDLPVAVEPLPFNLDAAYDPRRRQHLSTRILEQLREAFPAPAGKLVALTGHDLFIPILTYVFGEARLNGPYGVVSVARLRNEFHGGVPDPAALRQRTLKELVHELGHTFGLRHCADASCVMFSSHNLDDTDAKDFRFCRACRDTYLESRASQ
jgi:archaemetzincin